MRILTAFTNSLGGRDSYHLGVSLAEAFSCPLDLVTVVKGGEGRYVLDGTASPSPRASSPRPRSSRPTCS